MTAAGDDAGRGSYEDAERGSYEDAGRGAHKADKELVARAVSGETRALEEVVTRIQDPLYRLALRMTARVPDAEDAVQDILIRVITRLATYRGEAALLTWAYRVGVNHLLNLRRKSPQEQAELTFDEFGEGLARGLAATDYAGPDEELLTAEVRLNCGQALVQCLDRTERVAFVLGTVFALPSTEAAWIMDTTPAAYRKRLERARARIRAFLGNNCGLVSESAACRCSLRIKTATATGRIDPKHLSFATHPVNGATLKDASRQMRTLNDVATVFRSHPDYAAPRARSEAVLTLVRSGRFSLLEEGGAAEPSE
ncbi:RNA polymerase sigma factor [Streptomyces sp. A7024]|uniref:RNA polymerase sigma factor n=1 Tax=Streptomyces coryli TaxID=1128680 RepID=A0A6G4U9Z9_9ACTN|nr:RNA polymerase sigma factor [Streptomyces coryli]NGN69004.1 RNA polymerase sigma factor [Streptomyces coryli]